MILMPSLYLLATQIHAITVYFIIADMKHCNMQGADTAHTDWAVSDNLKCSEKCCLEVQMTTVNKHDWGLMR